jgi:hypothetical protein
LGAVFRLSWMKGLLFSLNTWDTGTGKRHKDPRFVRGAFQWVVVGGACARSTGRKLKHELHAERGLVVSLQDRESKDRKPGRRLAWSVRKTSLSTSATLRPSLPSAPRRAMTMGPTRPACVSATTSTVERYR